MSDVKQQRREHIRKVYAETGSIRATRRKTGHSIGLIRKVIRGQDECRKPPASRPKRASKLDPHRALLRRLIVDDDLSAVLALEELRDVGFEGGYTIVKAAARALRPSRAKRPTTRVKHKPGAEGQVDWSPYRVLLGGEPAIVKAFSLVLPFSSLMFLRFAMDEQLETLLRLHDEAFSELGCRPAKMTYDNMTTVGRHIDANNTWINPRFAAWSGPYGFEIGLTRPYKPNDHAHVERHFHYVENNCLKRKRSRFDSLEDLNAHAKWWCDEVANVRPHGTWRQRPIDRFAIEKTYMQPLPGDRADVFSTLSRKVQSDYCVAVDTNRYSVSPRHVGKPATVHLYSKRLEILVDGEVIATHDRSSERYGRHVLFEHEEEFKRHTPSRLLLQEAFLRLGPAAEPFYEGLKARRGRGAGHHIKRLLNLADRHGIGPVLAAMTEVSAYGAYSADSVVSVLAGRKSAPMTTATGAVPMPPERVRAWLEGLDVESSDLSDYDDIIDGSGVDFDGAQDNTEDDDGD